MFLSAGIYLIGYSKNRNEQSIFIVIVHISLDVPTVVMRAIIQFWTIKELKVQNQIIVAVKESDLARCQTPTEFASVRMTHDKNLFTVPLLCLFVLD